MPSLMAGSASRRALDGSTSSELARSGDAAADQKRPSETADDHLDVQPRPGTLGQQPDGGERLAELRDREAAGQHLYAMADLLSRLPPPAACPPAACQAATC